MPDSPDGALAQILLAMGEIKVTLATITQQLTAIPDHEGRIRALERFRFTIAGASLFGGGLTGFIGYWVGHLIR